MARLSVRHRVIAKGLVGVRATRNARLVGGLAGPAAVTPVQWDRMSLLIAPEHLAQVGATPSQPTGSSPNSLPRSRLASRQLAVFTLMHDVDGPER
jgi:hypothetical protein